jgi:hypothetical protein
MEASKLLCADSALTVGARASETAEIAGQPCLALHVSILNHLRTAGRYISDRVELCGVDLSVQSCKDRDLDKGGLVTLLIVSNGKVSSRQWPSGRSSRAQCMRLLACRNCCASTRACVGELASQPAVPLIQKQQPVTRSSSRRAATSSGRLL